MDKRHAVGGLLALLLVAGCATDSGQDSPSPSESPSSAGPASGYGAVIVTTDPEGTKTLTRYPIAADGTLGAGVDVLTSKATFEKFPAAIDGYGDALATGDFSAYWTTQITLRDAATGAERSTVKADQWCGGDGLTYNPCLLLDATRLLRTSTLGGEKPKPATLTINSLVDGSQVTTFGPYENLTNVLATTDPNTVLITTGDKPMGDPPEPVSGTISRLDLTSGTLTPIGTHDADWTAVCALGVDSVLGYTSTDGDSPASVVGPATIGAVSFGADDSISGCSADGRSVYVQNIPAPPTSEEDDEAPNPATSIERINLADGSREPVQALEPGLSVQLVTR